MDKLILFLGLVFIVGTVANAFIFRRQSHRIKDAEARIKEAQAQTKEVEVLKKAFEEMEKRIKFYDEQFERMKGMMVSKDTAIVQLSTEKCEAQKENEKNKRAINKAHSCSFIPENEDCPVLAQKKKDEEKTNNKVYIK